MSDRTDPWLVLAGCFLLSVGVNAFMIAPSSIAPLFIDRFGITKAAAGNIISVAIIGSIVTQLPSGYLLDRWDNRWVVIPAVAVYVIVVVAIQTVGSFVPFLALRALGGIVAGVVFTAGANVVGQVFAADRRGLATGIYITSPPVSFAIAHSTSPPIGTAFGPLRVFLLHAAIAVVGVALFRVAAGDPIRSAGTPTGTEITRALGDRSIVLVSLSAFAVYALYLFLNTWLPTYGVEVLSLPLSAAGFVTAVVPLVGIVARPSGGWLSGYLGGRRRPVLAGGLLVGLVLLVAIPFAGAFLLFVALLAAAAFALQIGTGVYYVLTRELAAAGTEGTSLTVMTTISFTGSFVAPIAGGWLITGYSWTVAFAAFAAIGVLGTVALLPVPEPGADSSTPAAADP